MSKASGTARWLLQVLSWLVIMFFGAVLLVALVVPRIAGATPYVIETSSMSPKMPPGTLIVVRPTSLNEINPGDVITYQIKSGESTVVTHRVVAQGIDATGQPRYRTQGDANEAADKNWVLPVQIKGVVWYSIPFLGYVTSFVSNQQRGVITVLIALGLIGYALSMFRGAMRDRRSKNEASPLDSSAAPDHANQADVTP